MPIRRLDFPANFSWGVATSSHQNEGNNHNNDFWAWEQLPGKVTDHTTSGLVADWWQNAEADFDRAAALGLKSLRLSIEWSRIEPRPGVWDSAAFDRYRELLCGLHQRGITPLVTLHHFSNPLWLSERGGWLNPDVVTHFQRYTQMVVANLGDLVYQWGTINEPYIYATMAYLLGWWSPGKRSVTDLIQVMRHQVMAHAAAYHAVHRFQPHAEVGIVKHMAGFDAFRPDNRADQMVTRAMDTLANWRFLDAITSGRMKFPLGLGTYLPARNTSDFIGVNYYGRDRLRVHLPHRAAVQAPPSIAWPEPWVSREIYPQGLYRFLKGIHQRYHKPIIVTENGMADSTDLIRPGFLLTHLANVHRALQEGVDVRGYYHWTLVDNYEWTEGWSTRFGLIGLDPVTQERTVRRSAKLYREIIAANGITEEMVERYAPHVMAQVFDQAAYTQAVHEPEREEDAA